MAINLQAGNYFSALFGYVRSGSSVFPSMGSITGEPVAGQTLDFFYTSTGGSAIGFVGNQSTTLLSSITVDGVSWAVGTGTYDSGTDTTQYPVTPVGGGFADGVTYSVDAGGGGGPTYAGPTYVGKSTAVGGTGSVSPDFTSSGRASGDLLTLAVETANQALTAPGGWTEVATYSPQSRGTAGAAGGVRLTLFYKTSDGTETTVATGDSGDHQYAVGFVFRGAGGASVAVDTGAGNNVAATTSGSLDLSGSASGAVAVAGAASGVIDLGGNASAAISITGAVSGTIGLSGSATGTAAQPARVGTASGSIGFTGSSTGAVAIKGVTSSSLTLSGAATGSVSLPAISGDVSGTIPLGGFAYQRSGSSESRMWRPFMDSFAA